MYDKTRERAIANLEKRRKKERAMQIIGVVFGSAAVFLFSIRYLMDPSDRPYMFIPIGILFLIYCIVHTAVLGLPFGKDDSITESEIEAEVAKIYRRYKTEELSDLSHEEYLELKQMEEVLLDNDEDYV